jgi:uncharacterized membrane protein YeiH
MLPVEYLTMAGMAGSAAFAITAVFAAPRGMDLFGISVLAVIAAIGGGTIRDLILDVPVFWSLDLSVIWVALIAGLIATYARRLLSRKEAVALVLYIDGLGASLFSIQAVHKVWDLQFGLPMAPVLLGVVTGIGGGILRDVLTQRPTLLVSRELYAIPILLGCALYSGVLSWAPEHAENAAIAFVALIFLMRSAAITWNIEVPRWLTTGDQLPS